MSFLTVKKAKMATSNSGPNNLLDAYLQKIPVLFRHKIIDEYTKVKLRFQKGEFDSSGLSCGRLCENVLRFLQEHLKGTHVSFKDEIKNFQTEITAIEKVDKSKGNDSLRIIIPRALAFLHTLRNKRNIGHSGGDVVANQIDAVMICRVCDWIICEFIRIFHNKSLEEAQQIVDMISQRNLPDVWEINGKKRVLLENLNTRSKVLLLCYASEEPGVFIEDLIDWIQYSNKSEFKNIVLSPLHKAGMIEYDQELSMIFLSPKGVKEVEEKIISMSPRVSDLNIA